MLSSNHNISLTKRIKYIGHYIRYADNGSGDCIVLLHGYLETLDIWQDFANKLTLNYRVILIDLPGHGESDNAGKTNTMELMAETVRFVLKELKISKVHLLGHSMGGYVSLAFAEMYPDLLNSLIIFHSTGNSDTSEKIKNRNREIELVQQGKKEIIINTNIPFAFGSKNVEKLNSEISRIIRFAKKQSDKGIIASIEGMKSRKDRKHVLKEIDVPVLFIYGKHDNYIPFDTIAIQTELPKKTYLSVLENSGHMGFIEEEQKSINAIMEFISTMRNSNYE